MLSLRTDVLPPARTHSPRHASPSPDVRPGAPRAGRMDVGRLTLASAGIAVNTAAWVGIIAGVAELLR